MADSELEFDSDLVMHYRGQPFTGVAFERAANGAYCELAYVEGLQHGVTREWDAEGRLRATETWDANTRHGVSRTYDDHGSVVCEQWWSRDQQMQADSTGRRNTPIVEVSMGRPAGCMEELAGRAPMRSPGAPSHRREVEREFGKEIAKGLFPEEAATVVGASQAVGSRWFRHGGGMSPFDLKAFSGRYLSFREREETALLRAQGAGVRAIARAVGRSPSTISRELRRNAATRGGKLEYRASVAQWKAELVARRPKRAKLVDNPRLHAYVQDRLSGQITRADGTVVPGPRAGVWTGPEQAASQGPGVGTGVEPRADREPVARRLPG